MNKYILPQAQILKSSSVLNIQNKLINKSQIHNFTTVNDKFDKKFKN